MTKPGLKGDYSPIVLGTLLVRIGEQLSRLDDSPINIITDEAAQELRCLRGFFEEAIRDFAPWGFAPVSTLSKYSLPLATLFLAEQLKREFKEREQTVGRLMEKARRMADVLRALSEERRADQADIEEFLRFIRDAVEALVLSPPSEVAPL